MNARQINADINCIAKDISDRKKPAFDCIDRAYYSIALKKPITTLNTGQTIIEEVLTPPHDQHANPIPIGQLVSITEKYLKINDILKCVITKTLDYIQESRLDFAMAINLYVSFFYTLHQWQSERHIDNSASQDRPKQELVKTVVNIGKLFNSTVLAGNFQGDEDYHILQSIGIEGVSR